MENDTKRRQFLKTSVATGLAMSVAPRFPDFTMGHWMRRKPIFGLHGDF